MGEVVGEPPVGDNDAVMEKVSLKDWVTVFVVVANPVVGRLLGETVEVIVKEGETLRDPEVVSLTTCNLLRAATGLGIKAGISAFCTSSTFFFCTSSSIPDLSSKNPLSNGKVGILFSISWDKERRDDPVTADWRADCVSSTVEKEEAPRRAKINNRIHPFNMDILFYNPLNHSTRK